MITPITNLEQCLEAVFRAETLARLCSTDLASGGDDHHSASGGVDMLVSELEEIASWVDGELMRRKEGTYAALEEPAPAVANKTARRRKRK